MMTLWQRKWERQDRNTVPTTAPETFGHIDHVLYPNIAECLKIFSTLPVTMCECERNVLALRGLKTYMRSTMSQTRLTGLALLHIHYTMEIDLIPGEWNWQISCLSDSETPEMAL